MAVPLATGVPRVAEDKATRGYWRLVGPRGGRLASEGIGSMRDLVETLPDGSKQHYGRFPFAVGDGRASGGFVSADGKRAIAGFRTIENPRFGLVVIEKARALRIEHQTDRIDAERAGVVDVAGVVV